MAATPSSEADMLLRLIHASCDKGEKTYDEIFTNLDKVKDPPQYASYSNKTFPTDDADARADKMTAVEPITLRNYIAGHGPRDLLFESRFGPFKSKIKVYDWTGIKEGLSKAKEIASHIHTYCTDEAEDKLRELHEFVNERLLSHLQVPYEYVLAPEVDEDDGDRFDVLCTKANELAVATGKRVHVRFETEGVPTKIVGTGLTIHGDSWRELQRLERHVKSSVGDRACFREDSSKLYVGSLERPRWNAKIKFPEPSGARVYLHKFLFGGHASMVLTFVCYLKPFLIEWGNDTTTESYRFVVIVTRDWNAVCL